MNTQIQNYPNYTIDTNGVILSKNGKIKKPSKDVKGYLHITLSNSKKKSFLVHRLIALTFIPNPLNLPQVNHKNGIKWDNRVENLEWCNASTNIRHAFDNNLSYYKGESNGRSKLTDVKVIEIKTKIVQKFKLKDIAFEYNIHPNVISEIKRGIKWKHIVL